MEALTARPRLRRPHLPVKLLGCLVAPPPPQTPTIETLRRTTYVYAPRRGVPLVYVADPHALREPRELAPTPQPALRLQLANPAFTSSIVLRCARLVHELHHAVLRAPPRHLAAAVRTAVVVAQHEGRRAALGTSPLQDAHDLRARRHRPQRHTDQLRRPEVFDHLHVLGLTAVAPQVRRINAPHHVSCVHSRARGNTAADLNERGALRRLGVVGAIEPAADADEIPGAVETIPPVAGPSARTVIGGPQRSTLGAGHDPLGCWVHSAKCRLVGGIVSGLMSRPNLGRGPAGSRPSHSEARAARSARVSR